MSDGAAGGLRGRRMRRGGRVGSLRVGLRAHHQPVGQAQVDRRERAVEQRVRRCCKFSSRSSAATSCAFRQQHVGAAVHAAGSSAARRRAPRRRRVPAARAARRARRAAARRRRARRGRRPAASWRNCATSWSATIWPSRSISTNLPWFCQTANGRRSCSDTTIVPGSRRSTVACSTQASVSMRARAAATEKPRIGSPFATPSAARSSGSGVLARPSIVDVAHAQAERRGRAAEPLAQAGERAARRCSSGPGRRAAARRRRPNALQPSGRRKRRWRRASSFQPAGPVVDAVARQAVHARHAAFSTIHAQSCGKLMPRCAACSGSSEVGVRPGCVLTSSSTSRPGVRRRVVVAEIGARRAAAAERAMRRDRDLHARGRRLSACDPRRDDVARAAVGVFRLVVVEAVAGDDLRHRERAVAHHADGELAAGDVLFHECCVAVAPAARDLGAAVVAAGARSATPTEEPSFTGLTT